MSVTGVRTGADANGDNPAHLRAARRLEAIAFIDVVGYTALMAENEAATHARWMRILAEIVRPVTTQHRGRVVKSTGDGVLTEFPSALDAVDWAIELQRVVAASQHAEHAEDGRPILLRIAVNLGDIITTDDDIYGDGVNVAARLQEHAEPGGIVLSAAIYDLVHSSLARPARDLGLLTLKNLTRPVHGYALDPDMPSPSAFARPQKGAWPSVAILPLRNLGGTPDDDYFGDGLVDDIIGSLASLRELTVIARGSTLRYGQRDADPRTVGRALGVRYVMTGSLRRSPRQVRVSVQLWDVETGASLWTHAADLSPDEIFDMQDHIVLKIVAGIAPHVRVAELNNALRKRPSSFTAYDCTLRALDMIHSLDRDRFMQARAYLERAMAADPSFSMAAAWTGRWHSLRIGQGWSDDFNADADAALALAGRAIELDRQNAVALATYGHAKSFLYHDYDSALVYFERALSAAPSSALAWILSSATLSYIGRCEQAVHNAERALMLSPFDQTLYAYYMFLGIAHYASGNYEEAAKWGRMSFSENSLYTSTLKLLAAANGALGNTEAARDAAQRLLTHEPDFRLSTYAAQRLPFRDEEIRTRYLHHLAAAGLPA